MTLAPHVVEPAKRVPGIATQERVVRAQDTHVEIREIFLHELNSKVVLRLRLDVFLRRAKVLVGYVEACDMKSVVNHRADLVFVRFVCELLHGQRDALTLALEHEIRERAV